MSVLETSGSLNDGMKGGGDTGYEIIESKISPKMVKMRMERRGM